ncbi:MAG: DUF2490 domain-containing protein [Flavobacteriales bacterium]|jgi:hypothetical protein|nr:DUF2490 domain-containing protein [Flavobacteriales bacterium]
MRIIQNSIFLLLFCSLSAFAQENDFQSWYSVSLNKKIIKKTNLAVKTGLRLRENSSLYAKQFTDVKIKRKYNKRISYAVGYRYINKWNIAMDISNQNRFYADINYKNKLSKRFSYAVRNRWQTSGDLYGYKMTLRQKFALEYNIRKTKLSPSIAAEYFLTLEDGINKLRSTIALGYPLNKKLDFELAYRIQHEFYVNNPETLFIFEGKLAYDL